LAHGPVDCPLNGTAAAMRAGLCPDW
jgi:hypothetical protein